jgi:hypothetical protein
VQCSGREVQAIMRRRCAGQNTNAATLHVIAAPGGSIFRRRNAPGVSVAGWSQFQDDFSVITSRLDKPMRRFRLGQGQALRDGHGQFT